MFMFVIFVSIFAGLCKISSCVEGGGADARSTDVNVGCFSGDSLVTLTNGQQKQIGYLKTGEELLTVNQLNVTPSEMFLMLDKEPLKHAKFYTFVTASGHQISLTGLHLIPINSSNNGIEYIHARNVQLGDQFYVLINGQLKPSSVINITIEIKQGYFAPLTMTGTLLVNDIFASCFSSVKSHQSAQIFMTPFRWYYKMIRLIFVMDPFDNNRPDGIHWLFEIIYHFVIFIKPSTLQLS